MPKEQITLEWQTSTGEHRSATLDARAMESKMGAMSFQLSQVADARAVEWLLRNHRAGTSFLSTEDLGILNTMSRYGDKVQGPSGGLLRKSVEYSLKNNLLESDGHYRCCHCMPFVALEVSIVDCRPDASAFSKLSKAVRHTVLAGAVFDVDQHKAGASILLALACKYGLDASCLRSLVVDENFETSNRIMNEIQTSDPEQLKLAVNIALYGALAPAHAPFLSKLHREVAHPTQSHHNTTVHNTQ